MKTIILIISILLISIPSYAAKVMIEVPVDYSNAVLVNGLWQGMRPIMTVPGNDEDTSLTCKDGEIQKGGFDGWVNLPLVSLTKSPTAEVYIWTSPSKLEKMSKYKVDGKYKYKIKQLRNEKAKNKKKDLPSDNNGDQL